MFDIVNLSRREFLAGMGGFAVGVMLPGEGAADSPRPARIGAMVKVTADGWVTVVVGNSEMGQGICTGAAMMVAEELGADFSKVRWEMAPNDAKNFGRPGGGPQLTGGSSSVRVMMPVYRKAGAAAREMLLQAAAKRWGADRAALKAENGMVLETGGSRRAAFAALAEAAAGESPPAEPALKDRKAWSILGTSPARFDIPEKINGRAVFGLDVKLPGLLTASVLRPPVFGSRVGSFDAAPALAIKGVRHVVEIQSGIAVVADHYWAARKGRDALKAVWQATAHDHVDTEQLRARFAEAAAKPGLVADQAGDLDAALRGAAKVLDAVYEAPYLAHQMIEPPNLTAWVHDGLCEVWGGVQSQTIAENAAQGECKLPSGKIRIHTTYLGCGLGRRSEPSDVAEVVELAMAVKAPVKIVWSREEDMQHGFYRPMTVNALRAGLGAQGNPIAFGARLAGQSILMRRAPQNVAARKGIDGQAVECVANMPYDIANRRVEQCTVEAHVPVGFWRSVGASQNLFVVESFIDELAHAAGKDPYLFRRGLMGKHPRFVAVLDAAAEASGWGKPPPAGRGRGIAIGESFQGIVAQVAEVSVDGEGRIKVHRITAACDFGTVIHPGLVTAQVESSIVTGLDQTFFNRITIRNGAVEQSNFDTNDLPRIADMPAIDVRLLASEHPPGGVGEPAVPPTAPAIANALFALTGKRLRRLPIEPAMLKG